MLFFPQPQLRGNPGHLGMRYEDVWLTTEDGVKVHAWFITGFDEDVADSARWREHTGANACKISLLMVHGNGGNISVRLDQYRELMRRLGNIAILSLSYRGYGMSDGEPSEEGFARDAEAAYRWLEERFQKSNTAPRRRGEQNRNRFVKVLFGRSMGGAVAARLAARCSPDALILECAPSSIADIAKRISPWCYMPIERFIINPFDTESYVKKVSCPLLVMHSENDETVPYECAERILKAANDPKRFYSIPNASHNFADTVNPAGYYGALADFLAEFTDWR